MLFHELATNATKYGALSTAAGTVQVTISAGTETVLVTWSELGGPTLEAPAGRAGFGSQLIELSAVRQLGGTVERDWRPEGLVMEIAVPTNALSRA